MQLLCCTCMRQLVKCAVSSARSDRLFSTHALTFLPNTACMRLRPACVACLCRCCSAVKPAGASASAAAAAGSAAAAKKTSAQVAHSVVCRASAEGRRVFSLVWVGGVGLCECCVTCVCRECVDVSASQPAILQCASSTGWDSECHKLDHLCRRMASALHCQPQSKQTD